VQVMVPLQHGSPHEDSSSSSSSSSSGSGGADAAAGYGRVSVVKPGGAFTGDELALLARLVAAANRPGPGGVRGWGGWWGAGGGEAGDDAWGRGEGCAASCIDGAA
jgi:hypothetical protein